jgi:hypothetical protein
MKYYKYFYFKLVIFSYSFGIKEYDETSYNDIIYQKGHFLNGEKKMMNL